MKSLFCTLTFLTLSYLPLQADSSVSVERVALHHVVVGMNVFKAVNQGRSPKNWDDLGTVVELRQNSEGLERRRNYRIEDRYELLEDSIPDPGEEGSKIIMIRTVPLKGQIGAIDGLYRYAVIESKSGQIRDVYESEEKLAGAFKKAGAELPKYDNLPDVEVETPTAEAIPTPAESKQATVTSATPHGGIEPVKSTATPAVATEKPSSGFPIVPLVILAAVIVGAAVFFLRRKP